MDARVPVTDFPSNLGSPAEELGTLLERVMSPHHVWCLRYFHTGSSPGDIHGSDDDSHDDPSDLLRLWTYPGGNRFGARILGHEKGLSAKSRYRSFSLPTDSHLLSGLLCTIHESNRRGLTSSSQTFSVPSARQRHGLGSPRVGLSSTYQPNQLSALEYYHLESVASL